MMKYGLVFCAVLALIQGQDVKTQDSVKLQLYYESLCPDCTKFITTDFHKTYQAIGPKKIKLELIPVGTEKKSANGTIELTCHHGPKECHGNKVHACALNLYPIETAESFIHCLHKTGGSADTKLSQQCAKDVKISWNDIDKCMTSGQGDKLFAAYVKKTKAATFLKSVPTVVFDEKYSEEESIAAISNIIIKVCIRLGHVDGCPHNMTINM